MLKLCSDNAGVRTDPHILSSVLGEIRISNIVTGSFSLAAPWAFEKPAVNGMVFRIAEGAPFYIALKGRPPVRVESGDCICLPTGALHIMFSNPDLQQIHFDQFVQILNIHPDFDIPLQIRLEGKGATTQLHTCIAHLNPYAKQMLLPLLPPLFHIRHDDRHVSAFLREATRWAIEDSLSMPNGWKSSAARQVEVLLMYMLRSLADQPLSLLEAASRKALHPRVNKVLEAIHRAPEYPWDIGRMAEIATLSRTRFCQQFQEVLGQSPVAYLRHYRMSKAADLLNLHPHSAQKLADTLGYVSEKAFIRAFRRHHGVPPGQYLTSLPSTIALSR